MSEATPLSSLNAHGGSENRSAVERVRAERGGKSASESELQCHTDGTRSSPALALGESSPSITPTGADSVPTSRDDFAVPPRVLWAQGSPGTDLREGTREHRLFTRGFVDFLSSPALADRGAILSELYEKVTISTVPAPYLSLSDSDNYSLVRLQYVTNHIDIADGFYQEVFEQEDEFIYRLLLAQLLELHAPGVTQPDSTTAALVRDKALLMHSGTRGLLSTQRRYVAAQLRGRRIERILERYAATSDLSSADRDFLEEDLLANLETAAMCGLTHTNVGGVLEDRLNLLATVYGSFRSLVLRRLKIPDELLCQLWDVHLPVAEWLISRANARERLHPDEAYVVGFSGAQGSGKSTIHEILSLLLEAQGYRAAGLSLDDIYKTHEERQALKKECKHFRFRGPPGTHDVDLGLETIRQLRHSRDGGMVEVPVFDKSLHEGDGDRLPREQWRRVSDRVRIVILDGWCLGARAIGDGALETPINPIEASRPYDDGKGTFRRRINAELRRYHTLFDECDDLIALEVPNLGNIYRWRELQEAKLRAATGSGMDQATVRAFVDYYLPVTERYMVRLAQDPAGGASLVLTVGDDHRIRRLRRLEDTPNSEKGDWRLSVEEEAAAKEAFGNPGKRVRLDLGTAVVIADGVGNAPIDRDNPLFLSDTPLFDSLSLPVWSRSLRLPRAEAAVGVVGKHGPLPSFLEDASVLSTTIHASSEELGLKKGQPGDSSVGHASLGMGGYRRRYIGLIWDSITNGTFGENDAIRRPIEHVIDMRSKYVHPKLHVWGMCSRGYIHADIEVLYEILRLCAQHGLFKEEVIIHVVTDGKDVPKNTAGEYVRELEETLERIGVGVIGTICGRDGWLCNRDRMFLRDRNAPAARCVIDGVGVLPDTPSALAAIEQGKASEAGEKYGDDIDRFLPPTHIRGVRSKVESGDAMLCFNLREDRSVLFAQGFILPSVDNGRLKDFVYSTLIELRTLKVRQPYHLEAFRQREGGERVPLSLVNAGFVLRTFAESEKGQEVSNTYLGGHAATIRKRLGTMSPLLDVDPELYPTTPTRPDKAPEMKASEVADRVNEAMDNGVAILANLCNGDVIGHYGEQDLTQKSMKVIDREVGRLLDEARRKGIIVLLTADHGCVETWGPTHSANPVPFFAVFPHRHAAMAERLVVGAGMKALTDVEPTRFMLLGMYQEAHITGDSILIPDVGEWSDREIILEILNSAARNDFSLLRRCPYKDRIKGVLDALMRESGRQVVRMFLLRLGTRLSQLFRAQSPYVSEFIERFPEVMSTIVLPAECRERVGGAGARRERELSIREWCASLPAGMRGSIRVLRTTDGARRLLVHLGTLEDTSLDVMQGMFDGLPRESALDVILQGTVLDRIEQDVRLACALCASHLIVGTLRGGRGHETGKEALKEMLSESARLAKEKHLRLLIENDGPGGLDVLADRSVIKSVLEQGAPFSLLLNVSNAAAVSRSLGRGETDELEGFLSDRVLRSHIEAVRVLDGDEWGERVVRYMEEQGVDVTVIVENPVITDTTAKSSL